MSAVQAPRRTSSIAVFVLVTSLVVLMADQAPASVGPLCTVTRQVAVTTGGSTSSTSMSADGTRVAFASNRNIGGGNPDQNTEIYLHETTGPSTTQITSTTGGSNGDPSISADGTQIAFASDRNIGGGNADLNGEIYLHETTGPSTTQVTSTTAGSSDLPIISADGTGITFESTSNIGGGNADLNREIFVHDTSGPSTTQVSSTTGDGNFGPSISADGTRIAFSSTRNIGGGNADLNEEVFVHDTSGPSTTQVTSNTSSGNFSVSISADGTRIAFVSHSNTGGGNADLNAEIFVHDSTVPSFTQVTSTTGGNNAEPAISADGTRIAFLSNRDIGGGNVDLNREIFLHDSTGPSTAQVTISTGGSNSDPAISADGTRIAFPSDRDFTGENANLNSEIFLGACGSLVPSFTDVATGNVFFDQIEWMSAAGVASGFPDGTFKPQDAVKRQQMANFLYNLAGQPAFTPPVTPTFTDYPVGSTFYEQVEWMADEEVASGFPDGTFRPQDPVKRQQMANFLYNLAGQPAFTPPVTPTFTDYPVGSTFYEQVEWMADEEVASGFPDGTFRPQDPVKRQQMANFMYNFAFGIGVDV